MKLVNGLFLIVLLILQVFVVPSPVFSESGFQPSAACSSCHSNRHQEWLSSAMILGTKDVIFSKFFGKAPEALKTECLYCHSPSAVLDNDLSFQLETSKEQIPCDFCHTATKLIPGKRFSTYTHDPGFGKRGNLKDPEVNLHEGIYSEFHTVSEFCSGCHQYKFSDTINIDNAFEEWKNSMSASQGKQCQDCHMRPYVIKDEGEEITYYRNTFDGPAKVAFGMDADGSAMKLLSSGIILGGKKNSGKIMVSITNSGIGHSFPGSAHGLRQLVLEITGVDKSGKTVFEKSEKMGITLLDDKGKETYFYWDAVKAGKDSRIPSGENRTYSFDAGAERFKVRLIEKLIPSEAASALGLKDYEVVLKEIEVK